MGRMKNKYTTNRLLRLDPLPDQPIRKLIRIRAKFETENGKQIDKISGLHPSLD
jgi:hypothetical protein